MNRRDEAVVEVLVRHEEWISAERAELPPLARDGFVDLTERAHFDGYTLDAIVHATGMPRREARRALARLSDAGTVTNGGRFHDQFRLADGVGQPH